MIASVGRAVSVRGVQGPIEKRPSRLSSFRKEYDEHRLTLSTEGRLLISSKKTEKDVEVCPVAVEDVGAWLLLRCSCGGTMQRACTTGMLRDALCFACDRPA